jgi:hypothetical protein
MASPLAEKAMDYPTESKETPASESDVEKGTGDVEVEVGLVASVDKLLEKRLLRKFDLHILPLLAVMYLFK